MCLLGHFILKPYIARRGSPPTSGPRRAAKWGLAAGCTGMDMPRSPASSTPHIASSSLQVEISQTHDLWPCMCCAHIGHVGVRQLDRTWPIATRPSPSSSESTCTRFREVPVPDRRWIGALATQSSWCGAAGHQHPPALS